MTPLDLTAGRFSATLADCFDAPLKVLPLRERALDIPALFEHLIARHARRLGRVASRPTHEFLDVLRSLAWRGNVLELEALALRLLVDRPGKLLRKDHLPLEYGLEALEKRVARRALHAPSEGKTALYDLAMEEFSQRFVAQAVHRCGGNKAEAARLLGVSYATVRNKTSHHGDDEDP